MATQPKKTNTRSSTGNTPRRRRRRSKSKKVSTFKKSIFIVLGVFLMISLVAFGYFLGQNDTRTSQNPITQTYKTYENQKKLEKQRRETTNALAHDLKTPLSIISGYAQNLMENIHTEKREHYASNIEENVKRMDKIIRKMLELSRLESGSFQMVYEEFSLGEMCTRVLDRYSKVCIENHIDARLEGDAVIKADHALIERVIDNFFVNALDNTPEGGLITIKISDSMLAFYNSGSHIPEDSLNEIWLPYKKLDESRSNTKGTGLGLSISSTILELFKFSYGAKNSNEGVVFWFKFS